MKTHQREILIYYHHNSSDHRKTVAHAKGLTKHLKTFAFGQTPSTSTSWQMILKALDAHPKELLNKAHPFYQQHIRGREFDKVSWLNILARNPELIKAPIAIRGNRAVICTQPTDIYQLMGVPT